MMTNKDLSTTIATGVITYAVTASLTGVGVTVPVWVTGVPALAVFLTLAGLRVFVAVKGADNTEVDEAMERAEDAIEQIANVAKSRKL